MSENSRPLLLQGVIVPHEWDHNDKPIAIRLETNTEESYIIGVNRLGDELLHHIREEVQVMGACSEDGNGGKTIMVEEFILLTAVGLNNHPRL